MGALEHWWCPNSALLGFFGIWLGSNLSRQEKLVLLIGSHVPAHDLLEAKQDFFRTQGFFVVEGRSHYEQSYDGLRLSVCPQAHIVTRLFLDWIFTSD